MAQSTCKLGKEEHGHGGSAHVEAGKPLAEIWSLSAKTVCKIALTALVNLTDSITVCAELTTLDGFVDWLLQAVAVCLPHWPPHRDFLISGATRAGHDIHSCR